MSSVHKEVPKRLSVCNELHRRLKVAAVTENRPLRDLTEEFIRKGLEEREQRSNVA